MSLSRIPPLNKIATRGGLAVYGPGSDGDVTVISNITLSRDMYYNNLTLLSNTQIDTNGYRIFVKNTLHLADTTSVIGRLSNKTTQGTIKGGALSGIKASDTLGGHGGLNPGENFFGETEFYNFSEAIAGYKLDAVTSTIKFLMGGSGGSVGPNGDGSVNIALVPPAPAGSPGSPGINGSRPGYSTTVGAPGGKGAPGNAGSPGNAGTNGSGGSGGVGGVGGSGGGVVIISARYITGYGIIRADGDGGLPGSSGSPGQPATPGNAGAPGNTGTTAPNHFEAAYTYISQYAYNFGNPGSNPSYNFTVYGANYSYPATPTTAYNVYYSPAAYDPGAAAYGGNRPFTAGTEKRTSRSGGNEIRGGTQNPFARNPAGRFGGNFNAQLRTNPVVISELRTNPATYGPVNPYYAGYPAYFKPAFTAYGTYTQTNYPLSTYPYSVNTFINGNSFTNFEFSPQQNTNVPAQFWPGGLGGAGGIGGAGGTATPGLPGSPGIDGYAGGGGVVLIVTENNYSPNIEIRAAAGSGGSNGATSGTVIIIKNEAGT